jgi:tRNA(Glu) U13 pseudouridine synthase TruD
MEKGKNNLMGKKGDRQTSVLDGDGLVEVSFSLQKSCFAAVFLLL